MIVFFLFALSFIPFAKGAEKPWLQEALPTLYFHEWPTINTAVAMVANEAGKQLFERSAAQKKLWKKENFQKARELCSACTECSYWDREKGAHVLGLCLYAVKKQEHWIQQNWERNWDAQHALRKSILNHNHVGVKTILNWQFPANKNQGYSKDLEQFVALASMQSSSTQMIAILKMLIVRSLDPKDHTHFETALNINTSVDTIAKAYLDELFKRAKGEKFA